MDRRSSLLGYLGAFRRPAVSTTEQYNVETQGKIPLIKCIGAGFGVFMLLTSLSTLMYLLPPPWAAGNIDVAWIVFWLCTFTVSVYTLRRPMPHSISDLRAWQIFVSGLLVCLSMWGVTKYTVSLHDTWWHENYWIVFMANALLGLASFGILYIYWNVKETITPFELTGFDRVLWRVLKPAIEGDINRFSDDSIDALRLENEELKAKLDNDNSTPLVRTNTYAGRLTIAELEWKLSVTQFLFMGAAVENGFGRSKWVGVKLPSGLTITDALWRYLCGEGGELRRAGNDVLVKSGRRTVLNSSYSPVELAGMAARARLPDKMKPKK